MRGKVGARRPPWWTQPGLLGAGLRRGQPLRGPSQPTWGTFGSLAMVPPGGPVSATLLLELCTPLAWEASPSTKLVQAALRPAGGWASSLNAHMGALDSPEASARLTLLAVRMSSGRLLSQAFPTPSNPHPNKL